MLHFARPKLFCGNYENNSFIKYEVYNICLVNLINHRFGILKSQICMVGDRGFFCIHLAERDIYPLWYDGDTLQMKSLNTEELLPIFKQYQLFTAGERLVACSEDNTVLNTLEPPYDKISSSVSIHDEVETDGDS